MATGIVARQYKQVGAGKSAQVVEEYKVDTAMLAEWRANDDYVAETLGQSQRGNKDKGGDTYNVLQLVRYVQANE